MNDREPSAWAIGWTAYVAFLMIMMGFWWIITGIAAIAEPGIEVATMEWVFMFDATTWGWIHLLLGIVLLAAGFGLFKGAVWARTLGVILALLAGVLAFAWLPWHPIWAVIHVAMSWAVIWALTTHGRDITA